MILAIRNRPTRLFVAFVVFLLGACSNSAPVQLPLTSLSNIHLPKETGSAPSVGLLTFDARVSRLYVPHGSNASLEIIDAKTAKVVGSVPGLSGIKGVALSSDPTVVYTSNSGDGTVGVVDVNAMKVLKLVRVGGSPDAIDYDAIHDLVVVSTGSGRQLALIDRILLRAIGTITLPGTPGLIAVDANAGRVFVAINDKDEVDVIDESSQQVTAALKGCDIKAPTGLAFDADQNRLFVADHLVMSVIDLLANPNRCLGSVDIGSGTDQIALNPHTQHVYAANAGSRNLSIIDSVSLKALGTIGTARGAATLAVDPTTDKVYVALPFSGSIAVFHDP